MSSGLRFVVTDQGKEWIRTQLSVSASPTLCPPVSFLSCISSKTLVTHSFICAHVYRIFIHTLLLCAAWWLEKETQGSTDRMETLLQQLLTLPPLQGGELSSSSAASSLSSSRALPVKLHTCAYRLWELMLLFFPPFFMVPLVVAFFSRAFPLPFPLSLSLCFFLLEIYVCMFVCICICMCMCINVSVSVSVYVSVYVYVYMCMCMYV